MDFAYFELWIVFFLQIFEAVWEADVFEEEIVRCSDIFQRHSFRGIYVILKEGSEWKESDTSRLLYFSSKLFIFLFKYK